MTPNDNREEWLRKAVVIHLTPLFKAHGATLPDVRVSCGFPSRGGTSSRNRTIGQCWSADSAADFRAQIFISPMVDNGADVLATLVHEVVHACVGVAAKHGKLFKQLAIAVGLEGKMTATVAGPALSASIATWLEALGPYPHASLSAMSRDKQTTRLVKCECGECGYTVRTTAKWITALGTPLCPCNNEPMSV